MRIASWNVNSIKARLEHVKNWLESRQPDVLMVQELKGLEFPAEEFEALGYQSVAVTQKAYNGVAVLSRHPIETVAEKLPGGENNEQARYLEVMINGLCLIDIYLPNGNPVFSSPSSRRRPGSSGLVEQDPGLHRDDTFSVKFNYKLTWMERLKERLAELRANDVPFAIGGDFNVIPEPRDCYDSALWAGDALFRIETRQKFRSLLHLGLTDHGIDNFRRKAL